jgi:hypothetical protein
MAIMPRKKCARARAGPETGKSMRPSAPAGLAGFAAGQAAAAITAATMKPQARMRVVTVME